MKKFLALISLMLLASLLLTGCSLTSSFDDCEKGSGTTASQNIDKKAFTGIDYRGQGTLYLTQANKFYVGLETDDNLIDEFEMIIVDQTLIIKQKDESKCLQPSEDVYVWVTMPQINLLAVSGSANIEARTDIISDNLNIKLFGAGNIQAKVNSSNVNTEIMGSGQVDLSGRARQNKITVSGSGMLASLDLQTDNVDLTMVGSGMVKVNATNSLSLNLDGSSRALYRGQPQIKQQISGSASFEQVN